MECIPDFGNVNCVHYVDGLDALLLYQRLHQLMWILYNDGIDSTVDKEISFWLVATILLCWSIVAMVIGFYLTCAQKLRADEI